MNIIAIDPGISGGVALYSHTHLSAHAMPDTLRGILDLCAQHKPSVAYIEKVGGFTGEPRPGSAMFKMGENFGALQGVLAALGVRTILITPQRWQKHFNLGTRSACAGTAYQKRKTWKNKLKAEAQRRFPDLNVTNATADALLLLEYAITQEQTNL